MYNVIIDDLVMSVGKGTVIEELGYIPDNFQVKNSVEQIIVLQNIYALSLITNPVCYNGDIFTAYDYNKFTKTFPEVKTIMLGRGILANPGLIYEIKDNTFMDKEVLKDFHDEVFNGYRRLFNNQY